MFFKKSFIVFALSVFVLSTVSRLAAQTAEDDGEVIKVDVALVNVPFSVSDREGRSVFGLTTQNLSLFEDGKPLKIEYLSTQDNPLNIILLLDTSQSAQDQFDKIKNAASEFIKQMRPKDKCMIVGFDAAARVKSEFTGDQNLLDKAIKRTVLSEKPGTLLRDAVSAVMDKEFVKVKGRKAIILITDGKDAGSAISKNDLLFHLTESDAPIYSIFYETILALPPPPINPKKPAKNQGFSQKQLKKIQADQQQRNNDAADFLGQMSDVTGGISYRQEINNLAEAFNNITEELRKQYLVGFYPDDTNYVVSKHQLKIKVDKKNIVVKMKNYAVLK